MSTDLAKLDTATLLERVVVGGDLSKLTTTERLSYYRAICDSVGLNPYTAPFSYLYLSGKMVLYANKGATEQLRHIHGVRVTKLEPRTLTDQGEEFYEVTAYGINKHGREDADMGVVSLGGLHGQDRANAKMKAVTKAKRRLTLSLCGLGMLDESEVDVPEGARVETEVVVIPQAPPEGGVGRVRDVDAQVATLFPSPEADRTGLIQRARIAAARLDKKRVGEMKAQHLGSSEADYKTCDLSALVGLVTELEGVKL